MSAQILPAQAQTAGESGGGSGSAGSTGASSGSHGISDDNDAPFLKDVQKAKKFGATSREYIGSLCELGMHYNRKGQYLLAHKILTKMHRTKEAQHYKDEADKINKSIRPL
ncbi:MAG: hypothetical protein KGS72_04745 [Cyanobacteria bacterium REEB67]|nr:hypothetical protein [Cyanobacteria bacterium REEB67]